MSASSPFPSPSSGTFIRHGSTSSSAFDSTSTVDELLAEDRVFEYRARIRLRLPKSYQGQMHLLLLLVASILGTALPLLSYSGGWLLAAFVVPPTLLYANALEYCLHRYAGHEWVSSSIPPLRLFRKYHAVVHHAFFEGGASSMKIETNRDIYFVLFPSWVYAFWATGGIAPMAVGVGAGSNVLSLILSALSFSLFQYELLHTFHHQGLPSRIQAALEAVPVLRRMKRRHALHHGVGRRVCYNITCASAWSRTSVTRACFLSS